MDGKWGIWRMFPLILLMVVVLYWRQLATVAVAILVAILLTGCSTLPAEIVTVRVPIPVPCELTEPARPRMDTEHLALSAKVDVQNRAMRAEIDRREAYEGQLRTALRACTAPVATPVE